MADLKRSTTDLIAEVSAAARQEVMESLRPSLDRINRAIAELESALSAAGKPRARRGRPPKKSAGRTGRPAAGKRIPRGALKESVRAILASAPGGIKLAEIRNRLMKKALFRHRNSKTIYAQIVHAVQTIEGVKKTGRGTYALDAAAAAPKKRGRPAKKNKA